MINKCEQSQNPKLSVIIPVYNSELYLDTCIDSVVNQTYRNLEIILINDGSTDKSGLICDKWKIKDSRIRVIHSVNSGAGAARNLGIDASNGELISFIDSDDCLSLRMYETLIDQMDKMTDISECEYIRFSDGTIPKFEHNFIPTIQHNTASEAMLLHVKGNVYQQIIWNKVFRRSVIDTIRFPVDKIIDDEFFTYLVISNANNLVHTSEILYGYRDTPFSVMGRITPKQRLESVEALRLNLGLIKEKFPEIYNDSLIIFWGALIFYGQICLLNESETTGEQNLITDIIKEHPLEEAKFISLIRSYPWVGLAKMNFWMACRVRNLLNLI